MIFWTALLFVAFFVAALLALAVFALIFIYFLATGLDEAEQIDRGLHD